MEVKLVKFGRSLISRPSGREAYLAFQPKLSILKKKDEIFIDFDGVEVLTPSWADEFVTKLFEKYENVKLKNTSNPSVEETLKILGLFPKK